MGTAEDILQQLLVLPERDRTRLALALLKSVESFDPHADLTDEELAVELRRRGEAEEEGQTFDEVRREIAKGT